LNYGIGTTFPGNGSTAITAYIQITRDGTFYHYGDIGNGQAIPFAIKIPYVADPMRFNFELLLSTDGATDSVQEFGDAAADYSHTLVVTGLQVLDSSGNPIKDATWVAVSGYDYKTPPSYILNMFLPLILRN